MGGDLVSLRTLLVGAPEPRHDLWREGASMASIPIEFEAVDVTASRVALAKGGVDICLLDDALSKDDKAAVIRAARKQKDPAPLVFLSAPRGSTLDNIDGVLPSPGDAEDVCKLMEICIRARMPTQVLIAGDSDALRGILRKILEASRFELDVQEAGDSGATLAKLARSNISMVFLDASMPGLNGVDTLMAIKRQNTDVKIVLMANAVEKTASERRRLARVLVLKKPFYQADIDTVLKHYYGLHESS
ncbi:MAG TPA: response regulator [Pseudolabrys sp.]|nr:response regulator [Pseudolabrys sp.]